MRRVVQEATLLLTVAVLAFIVWFVIADTENQEIEARLGFSLNVEVEELGSDLVVAGDPLPVTVTVVGREADVESARPDHFHATVSLRNRVAGRHSLPVRVETLEGNVRVRAVLPETAVVLLQESVERQVPVVVEPFNLPPLGFQIGSAEALPDVATVSGIAAEVEAVETVVARLDLGGATATIEREVTLEARTAAGGAVTQVLVNPRFAQVRVPIEQELFRRTASILPNVVGVPTDGYRVRVIQASPATVDVLVAVDDLDAEMEVSTEPIDVGGRVTDILSRVELVFADGAAPAGDADVTTTVLVAIEPVMTSVTLPIRVEAFALRPGLELVFASPLTVRATLHGPVAVVSELEGPLSPIRVNLNGYASGQHRIELNWTPPAGIDLVSLLPDTFIVTLTNVVEPESVDEDIPEIESGEASDEPSTPEEDARE